MLQVENLNVKAEFDSGEGDILQNISFCVCQGQPLAIIGESGSGKTMCALALLGLLPSNCVASGSVKLDGKEILGLKERHLNAMRGCELAYIPQSGAEFLNPALKICSHFYETLKKAGINDRRSRREIALQKLAQAGLADEGEEVLAKYPHQLSGGQAQRTVLALSLCQNARLIIADEPTKGIDGETAQCFERCMNTAFKDSCLVIITHDVRLASKCHSVAVIKDGRIVEYGTAGEVLSAPSNEYTKSLIAAMPKEGDYA